MLTGKDVTIPNVKTELASLDSRFSADKASRLEIYRQQRRKLKALLAALEGEHPKKEKADDNPT